MVSILFFFLNCFTFHRYQFEEGWKIYWSVNYNIYSFHYAFVNVFLVVRFSFNHFFLSLIHCLHINFLFVINWWICLWNWKEPLFDRSSLVSIYFLKFCWCHFNVFSLFSFCFFFSTKWTLIWNLIKVILLEICNNKV